MRNVHSVHVADNKWETVSESTGDDSASGVRRLRVPGGWLYQVEAKVEVDELDAISRIGWSAPVFVPSVGNGDGS